MLHNLLKIILICIIFSLQGCQKDSNPSGISPPHFDIEDFQGRWAGHLSYLKVKLINLPDPELELKDIACSLKIESSMYFLDLEYYSENLNYFHSQWGSLDLDKNNPENIIFKPLNESMEQVSFTDTEIYEMRYGRSGESTKSWSCKFEFIDKNKKLRIFNPAGELNYVEMMEDSEFNLKKYN